MFENFELQVKLVHPHAKVPTRANAGDAGLDIYTPDDVVIAPYEDVKIDTGIITAFPEGYAFILHDKSGVATKKHLKLGAKIIDAGYRGHIFVHLINLSDQVVRFDRGDKIVQGVVMPVWDGLPTLVDEIHLETERGTGGFGSSGK